uniref:Putative secreted protein n=1 Tax=Anopheles marajoara TaxID=58244 RepID=A0A2M4CD81_9DIPT
MQKIRGVCVCLWVRSFFLSRCLSYATRQTHPIIGNFRTFDRRSETRPFTIVRSWKWSIMLGAHGSRYHSAVLMVFDLV